MRASRTRKVPEADAVQKAEGNMGVSDMARRTYSGGVCVAGMYENVQPRNLGGPVPSRDGRCTRNSLQGCADEGQEVRLFHSTEEAG